MSQRTGDVLQSNWAAMPRHTSRGEKGTEALTDGIIAPSLERNGSSKRQRSDAGPRLTERDLACLKWIAQQYAIRLDQLQRLLLRYTPEADRGKIRDGADRLSKERTYRTLEVFA
jgi:hypothetical protein